MNIKLAVIDHAHAGINDRERFAFTTHSASDAVAWVVKNSDAKGCVIISTCNRTEIYVSAKQNIECPSPFSLICKIKGVSEEENRPYFEEFTGNAVAEHLFYLACGMKSKIFGEDQIISQVKDAAELSRQNSTLDTKLELLFKSAITCAKKIKTEIKLSGTEHSLGDSTLALLQKKFTDISQLKILIIGNGEMGRLIARTLIENDVKPNITIRKYHRGDVVIPVGCSIVDYDDRFEMIPQMDVVISATKSPHYTIKVTEVENILISDTLFIDLALPRDIEKEVENLDKAQLYDIDCFETKGSDDEINAAHAIIIEQISQMQSTYRFKKVLPMLRDITEDTAEYVSKRVQTKLSDEQLVLYIEDVTKRAVSKLIYGVRDNLNCEDWHKCLEAMKKGAKN